MRRPLTAALAALALLPASAAAAGPFSAGDLALVSGQPDLATPFAVPDGVAGAETNGTGVSDDGRFVVFDGILPGLSDADSDLASSVFVKDRQTGAVTLASRGAGAPLTAGSRALGISDDGRRVLFASAAAISPDDANAGSDLYVRDLQAQTTMLVSRRDGAAGTAIGAVDAGVLSGDGRSVAFSTDAGNVDPAVTDGNGAADVYVRDLVTGATTLVSRAVAPTALGGTDPSISDDGVAVAFTTAAGIAGALDTNGFEDTYVRVVPAPSSTQLASRVNGGGGTSATGAASEGVISGDGTTVAWSTDATDLGDGDATAITDVHRSVLGSGVTSLVSRNASGAPGDDASWGPVLSDDGRTVGFVSDAANLDQFFTDANAGADAFVRRTAVNETELSTRRGPGDVQAGRSVGGTALTADGRQLVIAGDPDLAPDLDPRFGHVVVRDQRAQPRRTETISRPAGSAAVVNAGGSATLDDGRRVLSVDGRFAVVTADAPGLVGAAPGVASAYRRDLVTGAVVPVATLAGGSIVGARALAISDDGARVLFSTAAALDPADGNGAVDLYVRDVPSGATLLASRADGPSGPVGNASSAEGALSGDGTRVAFSTRATNLGNGDTTNVPSVHVRDLAAGRTLLASRGQGAGGAQNADPADQPALNRDGGVVAFASAGAGYGDGGSGGSRQIHVRDLGAAVNTLASATPAGVQGDFGSSTPALSADGRVVAFDTSARNLTPDDTDTFSDIHVKDLATGAVRLASRADGPAGANVASAVARPALSADGTRVGFIAAARDLDPTVTGAGPGTAGYVRDLAAGTTRLVTHRAGEARVADRGTERVGISADGACAVFTFDDQATTAIRSQVFLRAVRGGCAPGPATPGTGGGGASAGGGATGTVAATDRTAPRITGLAVRPSRVRRGRPFTVRFTLSEPASVQVRIARATAGRRVGRRCRAATPKLRKRPRCELLATRATVRRALRGGAVAVPVGARPGGRRLSAGRHVLLVTAVDAAGNRSAELRLRLTVRR